MSTRPVVKDADNPIREAAALIPVYRSKQGDIRLVLVRRSEGGAHGGQLAFPGGKPDPGDGSLLDTALREAWEETGISPDAVEILAHLPPTDTRTSGFRIFPFLARIIPPVQWRRNEREVAEILDVRLADLALPESHGEEIKKIPTLPEPQRMPFYRVGPHQLWGVTYRILHPLIPRLLGGEWKV